MTANSGRERTTAFVYSVGWTQHTVGAQYIRTASILQALLGNMGRPGGGIMALRGHASIQGSTDIPTLFNLLPGYLPMPHADAARVARGLLRRREPAPAGSGATCAPTWSACSRPGGATRRRPENDFCFDYLPRINGDHSSYRTVADMIEGKVPGYFLVGENPTVGHANGRMQRFGLANLDWLVVRDLQMIESATFWKDAPEIETGELVTEEIGTEVFFLPAATHVEKEGTFTQTQRLLQWRHKAVEPPGDCPQRPVVLLPPRPDPAGAAEGLHRPAGPPAAGPDLGLPDRGRDGRPERRGGAARDQRRRARTARRCRPTWS